MTVAPESPESALAAVLALSDEPTDLGARVLDMDGDVWARHAGRWGCLTVASATQTWSDLWHVCGPLTLAATPTAARTEADGAGDAVRDAYDRASAEIDRLTSAPGGPGAAWRWSIPAKPDRDSDLIFADALAHIPALLARIAQLEAEVAAARSALGAVEALAEAGDKRTLGDFDAPCILLDDLNAALGRAAGA